MSDTTAFPYENILVRDNLADTGAGPGAGWLAYQSPDIIPYQNNTLTLATATSQYADYLGNTLTTGQNSINNLFVRAKNVGSTSNSSLLNLYYSKASFLNDPAISDWTKLMSGDGIANIPVVGANGTNIAANEVGVTKEAFILRDLPAASSNDHYCLMSVANNDGNEFQLPNSAWSSNSAFCNWVLNTPEIAWRNIALYSQTASEFSGVYQFGNINDTAETFSFDCACDAAPYLPQGTVVTIVSTDQSCQFTLTATASAPPTSGQQKLNVGSTSVPAQFTGSVTLTVVPPSGTSLPSGISIKVTYGQVANTSIELDMKLATPKLILNSDTGVEETHNIVEVGAIAFMPSGERNSL